MINLLPQSEKRVIQSEKRNKVFLILEILGLIFLICFILIIFSISIYVRGHLEAEKMILERERTEFENSEIKDFSEKIKAANEDFSNLVSFYENQESIVLFLEELAALVPNEVKINTFMYNKNSSKIFISGFAKDTDSLLEFKQNIEEVEMFKDPKFPPSAWIKQEDIRFDLSFDVNDEE